MSANLADAKIRILPHEIGKFSHYRPGRAVYAVKRMDVAGDLARVHSQSVESVFGEALCTSSGTGQQKNEKIPSPIGITLSAGGEQAPPY